MSNTRTVVSPGVFADDAVTTIPAVPSSGVAYRDLTTTQQDSENGWRFNTRVDSSKFNQILHDVTALLKIMDTRGLLGWNDTIAYTAGALVLGSDGVLYQAQGSSTGVDPTSGNSAWARVGAQAASAAEVVAGTSANKFVSPATLLSGLGAASFGASGSVKVPVTVGGIRREFILQWGTGATSAGLNTANSYAWAVPFPNAIFFANIRHRDDYGSGSIETVAVLQSYSTTGFSLVNRAVGDTAVGAIPVTVDFFAFGW